MNRPDHVQRPLPGVWAVFSTFRPGSSVLAAVTSVRSQVDGVVVVDDGSGAAADEMLGRLSDAGALVHRMPRNAGIAAALNAGIRLAIASSAQHVVTFDQDSDIPPDFVVRLSMAAVAARFDVGIVVPEYVAAVCQSHGPALDGYSAAGDVIQSGMLIPAALIDRIGYLREDLFIDLVDTEYEMRVRCHGYGVFAAPGLALGHALGAQYRREVFGLPVRIPGIPRSMTLSAPFRYFYRVRNRIVVSREYLFVAPGKVVRDGILDMLHFLDVLRVARPRRAMWRVYRAAFTAAFRGRSGRMPAALETVAARITWAAPLLKEDQA